MLHEAIVRHPDRCQPTVAVAGYKLKTRCIPVKQLWLLMRYLEHRQRKARPRTETGRATIAPWVTL